jgi:hypothetical protein
MSGPTGEKPGNRMISAGVKAAGSRITALLFSILYGVAAFKLFAIPTQPTDISLLWIYMGAYASLMQSAKNFAEAIAGPKPEVTHAE